jgi:hypothetical protein
MEESAVTFPLTLMDVFAVDLLRDEVRVRRT